MYKNKVCFTISLVFLTVLLLIATVQAADGTDNVLVLKIGSPNMLVNGTEEEIDPGNGTTPTLVNERTLVPIRAIVESMGGTIEWEESEEKVTTTLNGKVLMLWLDKNTAMVNGTEVQVEVAPTTINDRTMMPLRFVSENLGLFVNWEENTQSISISNSGNYVSLVAGEKIIASEFNIFLNSAKQEVLNYLIQNKYGEFTEESVWKTIINGKEAKELAKDIALDYAKEFKILLIKAKENNIALNSDELKSVDSSIEQMASQQGGKEALEKQIKAAFNIGLSEYTEFYKNNMLINRYIEELRKGILISEDDIKGFYETNKSNYDAVTVKHILLSTVDQEGKSIPAAKLEEVKIKADELLAKVKAGEDFAALVKQHSQDPGSIDNGGEYTFRRGEMVKEFEDWSFAAKPGDVGIVKTTYGYHVMKFVKKITYDDVKEDIRSTMKGQQLMESIEGWKKEQRFVVIKNEDVYNAIIIE